MQEMDLLVKIGIVLLGGVLDLYDGAPGVMNHPNSSPNDKY